MLQKHVVAFSIIDQLVSALQEQQEIQLYSVLKLRLCKKSDTSVNPTATVQVNWLVLNIIVATRVHTENHVELTQNVTFKTPYQTVS